MITKLAPISGIEETVITPMVTKIVSDLNNKFIKDSDAFINMEYMYNDENVSFKDYVYDNAIGGSNIDVNIKTTDNEELSLTNSVYKPINKLIFLDKDNGFFIRPLYVSTDIELTIRYRCQSKQKMNTIRNNFRLYYSNSSYNVLHNLPYSYLIPNNVLELTTNISKLKDDTISVTDYITSNTLFKFDMATTRNNKFKVPAFRGEQVNVIGTFLTEPKDIDRDKGDVPEYIIEFNYILTVQKPMALAIQYPILIKNKKLDDKWIPKKEVAKGVLTSNNMLDIRNIIANSINTPASNIDLLYRIPTYDNFVPWATETDSFKVRLVSMLLEVDTDNLNKLFNIADLKYIGLNNYIVDYLLATTSTDLFNFGNSLFLFELFEQNSIKDYGLYKDDDNNIVSTKELDSTKVYHLLVSMVTNLNYLNYLTDKEKVNNDIELCNVLNISYLITNKSRFIVPKKTIDEYPYT